jgi:hypothetical protein
MTRPGIGLVLASLVFASGPGCDDEGEVINGHTNFPSEKGPAVSLLPADLTSKVEAPFEVLVRTYNVELTEAVVAQVAAGIRLQTAPSPQDVPVDLQVGQVTTEELLSSATIQVTPRQTLAEGWYMLSVGLPEGVERYETMETRAIDDKTVGTLFHVGSFPRLREIDLCSPRREPGVQRGDIMLLFSETIRVPEPAPGPLQISQNGGTVSCTTRYPSGAFTGLRYECAAFDPTAETRLTLPNITEDTAEAAPIPPGPYTVPAGDQWHDVCRVFKLEPFASGR